MANDLIDRQDAIDAVENLVASMSVCINVDEYNGMRDMKYRALKAINELPSAQPDLDSAYSEGYTAAESKYRKMWDEMQANIKEKAFGKRKGLIHTADICLIDRDALLARYDATHVGPPGKARDLILNAPIIEPEQKVEELLPDGTLHLFTDTDLSKVDRVWVSQNGTHFGDLYYADGEPKIGKWERHYSRPNVYADLCWHCSNCGYKTPDNWANKWKFRPNCGARMQEGEDNDS